MKAVYKEALRYLHNAEELLRTKVGRENGYYRDKKYVQMAGNTAWNGVLHAINSWLSAKGIQIPKRPNKEWYNSTLSKRNRKLNTVFESAYTGLHLGMDYDGQLKASIDQESLKTAREIIALCERDN